MEQQLLADIQQALSISPCMEILASARSLILNSSTSTSTVSQLLEMIARFMDMHGDRHPHLLPHALVLLSDIAHSHKELSPPVFKIVRGISLLKGKPARLGTQSLNILAAMAEGNESIAREMNEIGKCVFLSLCFGRSVSVRPWLLLNAYRFRVRPSMLVTVFFGFTRDPFPRVRLAALSGLAELGNRVDFEDRDLVEGCFRGAIGSLSDTDDGVRLAALKAVTLWGLKFIQLQMDTCKRDCYDILFLQLGSMVRDMSVEVRVAAFEAIGRLGDVSEDILLQTMSKRALKTTKERKFLDQNFMCGIEKKLLIIPGAFVHGLEDEYYEVRRSACCSLQSLTSLSAKFAEEALSLLIYVLNNDTVVVRLQALTTLQHMAIRNPLKVQEIHINMLIGTLMDNNARVRSAARIILISLELAKFNMFMSCFDGLLVNLKQFPQDEAEVFNALFRIGCGHGKFAASMFNDVLPEIEPPGEGRTYPDNPKVAALLVLAISASRSKQPECALPPTIFSYAVLFLGKISRALRGIISQDALLTYLSLSSRSIAPLDEFGCGKEDTHNSCNSSTGSWKDVAISSLNSILESVVHLWLYLQSGHIDGSIRTLMEQLEKITGYSHECDASRDFTMQYIRAIELLAKVSRHFLSPKDVTVCCIGTRNLMLEKLDRRLTKLLHVYIGLAEDEVLHFLEFIMLTCLLRLCGVESNRMPTVSEKLLAVVSQVNVLHEDYALQPSQFFEEAKICLRDSSLVVCPDILRKLLQHFSLKKFVLRGNLGQLKAELDICGYDATNPLLFVPGLPVGIPLEIILYNVSDGIRLWLMMTVNELVVQFVFLDIEQYEDCDGTLKSTFIAPFYRTPNCQFFKLAISISVESIFESVQFDGGPRRELVRLCKDKEVHLCMR